MIIVSFWKDSAKDSSVLTACTAGAATVLDKSYLFASRKECMSL